MADVHGPPSSPHSAQPQKLTLPKAAAARAPPCDLDVRGTLGVLHLHRSNMMKSQVHHSSAVLQPNGCPLVVIGILDHFDTCWDHYGSCWAYG